MTKVTKKRAKRYDDGGAVNPMRGNFSAVNAGDDTDIYKAARARDADRENSDAFEAKIQELSNAPEMPKVMMGARPEYTEGKDYTIAPSPNMAAPSSSRSPAPAPTKSGNAGRGSYKGYDTSKAVESAARQDFARNTKNEALEEVHPEMNLLPGGGVKNIAALARSLAGRSGITQAAERAAPYLKEIGHEPLKVAREALKLGMKRGGAVKKMASGGSASKSSASSRGDGIASKGKTRGKIC